MFKNFFFEYFYYRIYSLWQSEEGSKYRGFRGACVIAVIQAFTLLDLNIAIVEFGFDGINPLKSYATKIAYVGAFCALGLAIYNFRKYDHRIEEFNERWDFESQDYRFIKGLIILLSIGVPFVPLIFFTTR